MQLETPEQATPPETQPHAAPAIAMLALAALSGWLVLAAVVAAAYFAGDAIL